MAKQAMQHVLIPKHKKISEKEKKDLLEELDDLIAAVRAAPPQDKTVELTREAMQAEELDITNTYAQIEQEIYTIRRLIAEADEADEEETILMLLH